ncbi:M17 family metallopeptidase [Mycoplasma marinum]|uniref:Probable cytosol aminopeptidase n=1 Tax=Mycoplasma marinum TaxID=1937190 RepID=A0A4R0XLU9_9MOLU|nr:leucyl aminopeptidase family protein [Mycoplasma marinum]TCG11689.1 peptidase M17 [Mycoplasma marinum]
MIRINENNKELFTLKGVFDSKEMPEVLIKEANYITEFVEKKYSMIYLGKKDKFTIKSLRKAIKSIVNSNKRGLNIDLNTFTTEKITIQEITKFFIEDCYYETANIYNAKTGDNIPKETKDINLINASESKISDSEATAKAMTWVRDLQKQPANILHSVKLAEIVKEEFELKHKNIDVKVIEKPELKKMGMNLLLAVNAGSKYDARIVVLEYKGNPNSEEKTVMVGKGITFDAGGYDIKINGGLIDMKYDMSGAAIVAGAMKVISELKPNANISAIMCITDNKISVNAITPDSVIKSYNGKTVEITDTDAEGRLVLADGLTYAVKDLKATKLIDVATLTGTVLYQLGHSYTGVWATNDKLFKEINRESKKHDEALWRLPFNEDYSIGIKSSEVADLMNYSKKCKVDSSQAAMFLKEFTNKVPYIHLDIAGTADVDGKPTSILLKTLSHLEK